MTGGVGEPVVVAERIRGAREAAGLTRRQLAYALGASPASPALWEDGRTRVSAYHLVRIARVLRVPVLWLLGEDGPDEGDAQRWYRAGWAACAARVRDAAEPVDRAG